MDEVLRNKACSGGALYIAWKFRAVDDGSAGRVWNLLSLGERRSLFRLLSRVVVHGEARALVAPVAPLESIAAAILEKGVVPLSSKWVESRSACAKLAREIESVPVTLGLTARPEQWPLSSAAAD